MNTTGAADRLGVSKSYISKQISALEERLEVRLIRRSTRKLTLTEVGSEYYKQCQVLSKQYDLAESTIADLQQKPCGTLKLALNCQYGVEHMANFIAQFSVKYPEISIDVHSTFKDIDPIGDGYDIMISYGTLKDSNLIARKLGGHYQYLVASPKYWAEYGLPEKSSDLVNHNCLAGQERAWILNAEDNNTIKVKTIGSWRSEDGAILLAAAHAGKGIAQLPDFFVEKSIKNGELIKLDYSWSKIWKEVYVIYPHRKYLSSKSRYFINYMVDMLNIK